MQTQLTIFGGEEQVSKWTHLAIDAVRQFSGKGLTDVQFNNAVVYHLILSAPAFRSAVKRVCERSKMGHAFEDCYPDFVAGICEAAKMEEVPRPESIERARRYATAGNAPSSRSAQNGINRSRSQYLPPKRTF